MFYPKKVFKASLIALTLSVSSFSQAEIFTIPNIPYLNTGEVKIYANKNISLFLSQSNSLNYAEIYTGYNYSCGPTALLFAHSYQTLVKNSRPDDLSFSVSGVKLAIDRQYKAMGLKNNSITSFTQLSILAKGNLGMDAAYMYTSPEDMAYWLSMNRIFVVNVKNGSPLNNLGMDHFITLLATYFHNGQQYMVYFDP